MGPRTKAAIAIVEQTLTVNKKAATVDGFLDVNEYRDISEAVCDQKFTNYFEKIMMAGGEVQESAYLDRIVIPAYKKTFGKDPVIDGKLDLSKARAIIAELRRKLSPNDALPQDFREEISTWITPQLHVVMEAKTLN